MRGGKCEIENERAVGETFTEAKSGSAGRGYVEGMCETRAVERNF